MITFFALWFVGAIIALIFNYALHSTNRESTDETHSSIDAN